MEVSTKVFDDPDVSVLLQKSAGVRGLRSDCGLQETARVYPSLVRLRTNVSKADRKRRICGLLWQGHV